ncbi:unnamed protein product [Ilex paraguariensis]|uniref:AB hydrolase-1 domain-containing protein n=1 Tax=Ilex paraguariensis TaxID=185542 RepID=A0ABC8S0P4_9AQUA
MKERKKLLVFIYVLIFLFQIVNPTNSERPWPQAKAKSKHFVLVHGACHGAWSWYRLVPLLRSLGHTVTAFDLAASGIDPRQLKDIPSVSDYIGPLSDFMAALPRHQKVVLVGHSLGGWALSRAMERFPEKISVAVFISALTPGPTLNISTLEQERMRRQGPPLDIRYTYGNGPNNPPTALLFGPLFSATNLYQLSPIEDLTLATTLLRPIRLYSNEDLSKELMLTSEKYGLVNRVFIMASEDQVIKMDFQKWMIERNPPTEVRKIIGSDHMVMMGKPIELSVHLQDIAEKYI